MKIIRMNCDLYEDLINYANENLPEEACGLIAGKENNDGFSIEKIYYIENIDHAIDHFTLSPKDQMEAVKNMRILGLKPLGNWHSHPNSPSRPSEEDIKLAYDSNASYMILSLMADYPVLNSFQIKDGKTTKEDLRIYSDEYYY